MQSMVKQRRRCRFRAESRREAMSKCKQIPGRNEARNPEILPVAGIAASWRWLVSERQRQ